MGNCSITLGAVIPRPYCSYAIRVAILTILEARAGPYSKSHNAQTEVTPANKSPIPPHLFLPPYVRIMKDRSFPRTTSYSPLINILKFLVTKDEDISLISSLDSLYFRMASKSNLK